MKKIIKYIRDVIVERKWLREKPCAACEHFDHYMGSAGVCYAKSGCPATRMRDYSDFCDCGCFKKRRLGVMETCNDCLHYEACKKIFQIAFKDFTDYTFVKACELYKPTADVVEVSRCKDCPHLIKEIVDDHEVFGCGRILELTGEWVDVFLDDFCSYGERKEGK